MCKQLECYVMWGNSGAFIKFFWISVPLKLIALSTTPIHALFLQKQFFKNNDAPICGSASGANVTAHHVISCCVSLQVFLTRE